MARFSGKIGYGISTEVAVDVWSDVITERAYKIDTVRQSKSTVQSDSMTDDIRMDDRVSIVADEFSMTNYTRIKYVERAGSLWTVTAVEVQRPRLILTLGGVYVEPGPT